MMKRILAELCLVLWPVLLTLPSAACADVFILSGASGVALSDTVEAKHDQLRRALLAFDKAGGISAISSCKGAQLIVGALGDSLLPSESYRGAALIETGSGQLRLLISSPTLRTASISHDCASISVAECADSKCVVTVRETTTPERPFVATHRNEYVRTVDHNDQLLAIGFANDEFELVDLATAKVLLRQEGAGISLSHDGQNIALLRKAGREIGLVNVSDLGYRPLSFRRFWENRIIGNLHWALDDKAVLFNVPAGDLGYSVDCMLVGLTGQDGAVIVESGERFCGPYVW
jgi:hypothetical protein